MERAVTAMLSLAHRQDNWIPPIVKTIATNGTGVDELLAEIDRCYDVFQSSTIRIQKKREAARQRLLNLLEERLVKTALEHAFPDGDLARTVEEIADRKTDPYTVVDRIIKTMRFS